jgi:mRNA-binding protein PUF3
MSSCALYVRITRLTVFQVEKKMYRYSDRMDSPSMPRDAIDAPPTPALSSSAPSPQSSSVPSTNTSTVGDPISDTPTTKANLVTNGTIAIEEATS